MSFLARYFSSLRRRPTSSSSPRRLWWSCLCTFRCSVRWLIRLVSSATWTSGEPVSPSLVAYSARISFLAAVSSGTFLLKDWCERVQRVIPVGARQPHGGAARFAAPASGGAAFHIPTDGEAVVPASQRRVTASPSASRCPHGRGVPGAFRLGQCPT